MIRFTLMFISTVSIFNMVLAANENVTIEQIYDMASNILNVTDKWQEDLKNYSVEGRKSKFLPFGLLPFHALWGFGGLNALAILFAIKFKFIVVASIIAFAVYYYSKFLAAKKCHGEHHNGGTIHPIHDTGYAGSSFFSSPITSYSSPLDISSHISYPSFDPYSAHHDATIHSDIPSYAFDHHDHHHDFHDDHHDYAHHSHDFEQYFPDHSHGMSAPGGDSAPSKPPPSSQQQSMDDSSDDAPAAMSPTYRRVGKHRRRRAVKPQVDFIDIGELAFRFLGVDTEGCRKRFVCELDFRAQTNPITRLAFSFIGRNFFERYRELDENVAKPQKFTDCAKIFNDCKDAEKYNDIDDEDEDDDDVEKVDENTQKGETTEETETSTDQGDNNNDNDEKEGSGDSQDEQPKESDSINIIRRKRTHKPIRKIIMNRRIAMKKSS